MTTFTIQAGEPFPRSLDADYQRIRVTLPADRDYWLTAGAVEALMQVREQPREEATLVADLSECLTVSVDEDGDILIDWAMTGAETRTLGNGYYDIVLSDPGATDVRSKVILSGQLRVNPVVTAAASA